MIHRVEADAELQEFRAVVVVVVGKRGRKVGGRRGQAQGGESKVKRIRWDVCACQRGNNTPCITQLIEVSAPHCRAMPQAFE